MNIFSKKRIAVLFVVCSIVCMVSGFTKPTAGADAGLPVAPVETASPVQAAPVGTISIYINGIKSADGYLSGETPCVTLQDFFQATGLQANITWDEASATVTAAADGLTLTAVAGQKYVTINGRCFYVPEGLQTHDNAAALPVSALAASLQYQYAWDAQTQSVSLTAADPAPLQTADETYNEQDLYWLAHLINAEAGNQPFEGKIGVGNVVLNRVADPSCPNSVHDVVFDKRFGVQQFSVITTGGIYAEPNADSLAAAKACLEGANVVGNALYFLNPTIASSTWFDRNRTFVATIGEHDFYA